MAKVKGVNLMTGTIGGITMYTMKGHDGVIARAKGGPSKSKIKRSASCARVRENNAEWVGCTKMGSAVRTACYTGKRLADYNTSGPMNALMKQIQKLDESAALGSRGIYLSKYKALISGFNFNKYHPFDSVMKVAPRWALDRQAMKATVTIPAFSGVVSLNNFTKLPLFRFAASLGVVPDMKGYNGKWVDYSPVGNSNGLWLRETTTEWTSAKASFPEQVLELDLSEYAGQLTEHDTLILCVGIEFASLGPTGQPMQEKYAGCGKVLEVG